MLSPDIYSYAREHHQELIDRAANQRALNKDPERGLSLNLFEGHVLAPTAFALQNLQYQPKDGLLDENQGPDFFNEQVLWSGAGGTVAGIAYNLARNRGHRIFIWSAMGGLSLIATGSELIGKNQNGLEMAIAMLIPFVIAMRFAREAQD